MTVIHAVVGDDVEAVAKRLELLPPGLPAAGVAVQQDERRRRRIAVLDVVDVVAVHLNPGHRGPPFPCRPSALRCDSKAVARQRVARTRYSQGELSSQRCSLR